MGEGGCDTMCTMDAPLDEPTAGTVRRFRAMGSDCEIRVVVDDDRGEPLLDRAVDLVHDLERRWSRFLPDSELVQLNAHSGAPVFVSPETYALVALAIHAWRATDGFFDPTLLDALVAAGYDSTFDDVVARESVTATGSTPIDPVRIGGPDDIELDPRSSMILAPVGLHLDLGGIGKGRAADLVLVQLLEDGATGACVDLGGDLRVGGTTAEGTGWTIVVDDPFRPGEDLAVLGVAAGSITTSSTRRRRWAAVDGDAHHLLDPRTARPSRSGLASVTVLAADAAWGEIHAKAALVAGPVEGRALVERAGLSALFVAEDGTVTEVGAIASFLLPPEDATATSEDDGGRR